MTNKPSIGFIGLGLMGSAMVQRLIDCGYPVTVIANRSRVNVDKAVARGATEVTSARALDAHQVALLKRRLVELLGKDVRLASKVDPSLLGGLIVKVGSRMIDSSLKTKLSSLKLAMKEVG